MDELEEKKKSKKTFKRVIKITCFIISSLVTLAFVLVMLLLDPYIYNQEYRKLDTKAVHEEIAVLALHDAPQTKKISYKVDLARLNELVHFSFENVKSELNEYVSNFYILEDNGGYDFIFEVKINLVFQLQSRLVIHTEIEEATDAYIFNIKIPVF